MKRCLHVITGGRPTLRVRNAAEIAAADGWTSDVITFGSAGEEPQWSYGESHHVPAMSKAQRVRRRVRRIAAPPDDSLDVNFPYYEPLHEVIAAGGYDIVHWKDLAGAVTGSGLARELGVRFVLDLHHNYPYGMWSTERDLGVRDDLYDLNDWFRYEARAVESADITLVTIDEMAQRLIGMYGASPEELVVFHNTEPSSRWPATPPTPDLARRFGDRFTLLYCGSCSHHRGMDTVIRALPKVRESCPDVALVIVGDGGAVSDWQRLARDLHVADAVFFEGPKPFAELRPYHGVADVGVVPHHKYGGTDSTTPHKLYQNMVTGLPTLVSSCHCLQRIAWDTGAAVVFEAGYPDSAADAITRLADPRLRAELGANGRRAMAAPPFSWEHSAEALLDVYRSFSSESAATPQAVSVQ